MSTPAIIGVDPGHSVTAFAALDPETGRIIGAHSFKPTGGTSIAKGMAIASFIATWCLDNDIRPTKVFVEEALVRYNLEAKNSRVDEDDDGLEGIAALRDLNSAVRTAFTIGLKAEPQLVDALAARRQVAGIRCFSRGGKAATADWVARETGFRSNAQDEMDAAFIAVAGHRGIGPRPEFKNLTEQVAYFRRLDAKGAQEEGQFTEWERKLLSNAFSKTRRQTASAAREPCEG